MTTPIFVVLLLAIVLATYLAIGIRTWLRFRGMRVVTCPETRRPAGVAVDVGHAVVSAVWEQPDVRIATCSRWPERHPCPEGCVPQIEASVEGTRVSTIAGRFFEGRRCVICGHRIGALKAGALPPGFLNTVTREALPWHLVQAADLADAIDNRRPLCPECTLAESGHNPYPITYRRTRAGSAPRP